MKPNDQLRAARHRTTSPTYSDECLSRQELAELINAWVWDHHNKIVTASANYIGQLERGTIRWPSKLYREALRAIFSVSTDSALGFVNARSRRAAVKLDNVKRKKFLHTATFGVGTLALGLESVVALLEGSEPTPIPARVGVTEIEQIRTAARMFSDWDLTYGSGMVRNVAMASLRYSAGLLDATCPARLRPELFNAVGDLAETTGYIALDASAHQEARRVLRFALACAEQADDWHLRACVLDSMALQEIRIGQPDDGLTLVEQALVRADDRLTATEQASLHTTQARALAKMRRVQQTLTAIGTAEEHFAHRNPANDPPFMAYYNTAFLTSNIGQALSDLAILGHHPEQATTRLTAAAAEHHSAGHARVEAICLTKLASLTMVSGDPLQAAALGHQALDVAGSIRSGRTAEELRELSRYAAAHQDLDEVAHLRHRISTLLVRTESLTRQESTPDPPLTPT
jgi:hypothetical protein